MTRRSRATTGFLGGGIEGDLYAELIGGHMGVPSVGRPGTDVYLTDDPPTLHVTVDVAGLDPETLHVVVDGDILSIAGRRRRPDEAGRRVYQHAEIDWGPFERHLRLTVAVDPEAGRVSYERGLLRVALPMTQRPVVTRVILTVRVQG